MPGSPVHLTDAKTGPNKPPSIDNTDVSAPSVQVRPPRQAKRTRPASWSPGSTTPTPKPRELVEETNPKRRTICNDDSLETCSFAQRVLSVIQRIPPGRTCSYGQVAELAGAARHAREVGRMLANGLASGGAPWHRVINAAGKISIPPECGGNRQRALLESEGVEFEASGRVGNATFWAPSDPDEFFVGWGR